jgi:hypothetical protein
MIKRVVVLIFVFVAIVSVAWAVLRYKSLKRWRQSSNQISVLTSDAKDYQWSAAVERVKADRGESMGGGAGVTTPPELKHYSERYWFLATQIAEITKYNIPTCQDYLDLAVMIQRGEMVSVPGVTDTYVLYGVGERVDDGSFTDDEDENKVRDYTSLQTLAKNFAGRSYNLDDPADRVALKGNMLSSLRPAALKILEEVASAYHKQFDRPLPISSLVRPEQYQRALKRVNRNAVLIETPPHSTGLAFDIDYRYMSAAEQTFVMTELARMKNEGRIEAIRERNANYHVFAFLNGTRPNDDLITASLDAAVPPGREAHHAAEKSKPAKAKGTKTKAKPTKTKAAKARHQRKPRR